MRLFKIYYDHDPTLIGGSPDIYVKSEVILAKNRKQALEMCSSPPSEMNQDPDMPTPENFWTVEEIDIDEAQVVLSSHYEESLS